MDSIPSSTEFDLTTASGVRAYLAETPFASEVITALSGGTANFVYRIHLRTPYKSQSTLVAKHGRAFVGRTQIPLSLKRQEFEVEALKRVKAWLGDESLVSVPAIHLFDQNASLIIMDDCGERSFTLKHLLLNNAISPSQAATIGAALGDFLGHLHQWSSHNDDMLNFFSTNEEAKAISAWVTYGRLIETLTGVDPSTELGGTGLSRLGETKLDVPEDQLEMISSLAGEMTERIISTRETAVMGDFWPGNVMVTLDSNGIDVSSIYVLDWELSKTGLAGLDIGQFCAELHLIRRFDQSEDLKPTNAATLSLTSFLRSYAGASGHDYEIARTAITHIGAHLVAWTPRVEWGGTEQTRTVVKEGVDLLVGGYKASEDWIRSSIVGSLIAP